MRIYRIYFTTYDDEEYREIINFLRNKFSSVKEIKSEVVPEFRFVEIRNIKVDPKNLETELSKRFRLKFKVDEVEIVLPSHKS